MKTNIRGALKGLNTLRDRAVAGAEAGMAAIAPTIEQRMSSTQVHGDDTGATRAAYVAYASGPNRDGSAAATAAAAAANARNPDHGLAEDVGDTGGDVVLIATSATDYSRYLVETRGGRNDAITPAIVGQEGAILEAVAAGIRRNLKS